MSELKIDLSQVPLEQLEAYLAEKKKEDRLNKLNEKKRYESARDTLTSQLVARGAVLNAQMSDFKQYAIDALEEFREMANEYGEIRKNSKGGFSLRHSVTGEMVSLDRNSIPEYDERASMAEELLKEFLEDKVKKKDLQHYRVINALMARNKQGDLIPSRIASLLSIKDNYDDPRWIKAIQLYEESFRIREISYSVSFYRKDSMQKDQAIVLTFASIPVNFLRNEQVNQEQK
ncbi:MAG: DUF3164 family protein [Bacteroidota bacterium]